MASNNTSTRSTRRQQPTGAQQTATRLEQHNVTSWVKPESLGTIVAFFLIIVGGATYLRIDYTPRVQPATAEPSLFSEDRARMHIRSLTVDIGDRQVSHPGLGRATDYLLKELRKLQDMAAHRKDLQVEVAKETTSGAVSMTFNHINFTNAYRALDNLVLAITPTGKETVPTLLVIAHYDSPVCSQGASDDASQVATMLEAARVVLTRPALPATPIIFLFTGGEEPISPSAHGWATTSRFAHRAGAFINLEATGGSGLPIVFQHTGGWTVEAWGKGAVIPRGNRLAQDVFDLHLIPADSDFRMFSARHYGSLPGIDVAFLLGSTVYHSYLDSEDKIKRGSVQEFGESLLGGMYSMSSALAARHAKGVTPEQAAVDAKERVVYFDIFGLVMASYSDKVASTLHMTPVWLLLCAPFTTPAHNKPRVAYMRLAMGALRTLASVILSVALPVALGVARVLIWGRPMVWFTMQSMGWTQYATLGLVGALLPWLNIKELAERNEPHRQGWYMASQLQGCGLVSSLMGAALTHFGLLGTAMIFSVCAALCFVINLFIGSQPTVLPRWALLCSLLCGLVPVIQGSSVLIVFTQVIMERMALSGFVSPVLADVVVAALFGAGVLATCAGAFLPLLAYGMAGNRKRWLGRLVIAALVAAVWSALHLPAYGPATPKRVIVSHLHQTVPADVSAPGISGPHVRGALTPVGAGGKGGWDVVTAGGDASLASQPPAMQVVSEGVSIAGADSTRIARFVNMTGYHFIPAEPTGREFTPVFPLSGMLEGVVVQPPPINESQLSTPHETHPLHKEPYSGWREGLWGDTRGVGPHTPLITQLPALEWVSVEARGPHVQRVYLRLYSQLPCWAILNVTGPSVVGWSFTSTLSPSKICSSCGGATQYVVRLVHQDPDPFVAFWADLDTSRLGGQSSEGSACGPLGLRIETSVSYIQRTPQLQQVLRHLPPFLTETWLATVYQSVLKV